MNSLQFYWIIYEYVKLPIITLDIYVFQYQASKYFHKGFSIYLLLVKLPYKYLCSIALFYSYEYDFKEKGRF